MNAWYDVPHDIISERLIPTGYIELWHFVLSVVDQNDLSDTFFFMSTSRYLY